MTDQPRGVYNADDAELLNMVRAGDADAFGVLYQRHEDAARRLASALVGSAAEVDDVVSETFARVLDVTLRGGGPTDAFRPYLLTSLRRICYDRLQGQRSQVPMEQRDLPDLSEPFVDPAVASLDRSLIVRAFLSLPERWIAVLWHTEIEEATPSEIAPLFGLNRNGVAALKSRAREGLRQAYLQLHINTIPRQECRPVAERLGAFVRGALSSRDDAMVTDHLRGCGDCRAACAELADVNMALRAAVAPIVLGRAAAAYLSGHAAIVGVAGSAGAAGAAGAAVAVAGTAPGTAGAGTAGAGAGAGAAGAGAAAGGSGSGGGVASGGAGLGGGTGGGTGGAARTAISLRHASLPLRLLAAGAGIAVGVAAIAIAVTLTGHDAPASRSARNHLTQAALSPSPVVTQARSASPAHHQVRVVAKSTRRRSATPPPSSSTAATGPSSSPPPGPSPTPTPTPTVVLTASISVNGANHGWHGAQVVFTVGNTGTATSGEVTASITLPAGAWMFGGGHGGNGQGGGWSCQPTDTGASCQDASISAGGQATGTIFIGVSNPSACGQPVEITATSGSASASATSSDDIQC